MRLIKEWQKAWQLSSVQTAVILGVTNAAFALFKVYEVDIRNSYSGRADNY